MVKVKGRYSKITRRTSSGVYDYGRINLDPNLDPDITKALEEQKEFILSLDCPKPQPSRKRKGNKLLEL